MRLSPKSPVAAAFFAIFAIALVAHGPSAQANLEDASQTIEDTLHNLYQQFAAESANSDDVQAAAIEIMRRDLLPHLDSDRFMKLILARHWRTASAEQRAAFAEVLTEFLLRSFAVALIGVQDDVGEIYERIEVLPAKAGRKEGRAIVDLRVRGDERTTELTFRMNSTDQGWKVYDVVFEGVSFAINYRAILNSEIGKHGIDEVTRTLDTRLSKK